MEMSVGERLRTNRACVKAVEAVTLFRDEPSLEKSTRLMKMSASCPFNFTRDQFTSDAFRVRGPRINEEI